MKRWLRRFLHLAAAATAGLAAFQWSDQPLWRASGNLGLRFAALDDAKGSVWLLDRDELHLIACEHDLRTGKALSRHTLPIERGDGQCVAGSGPVGLLVRYDYETRVTHGTLWDFARGQVLGKWTREGLYHETFLVADNTRVFANIHSLISDGFHELHDARDGRLICHWFRPNYWGESLAKDPTGQRVAFCQNTLRSDGTTESRFRVVAAATGDIIADAAGRTDTPVWLSPTVVAFGESWPKPVVNTLDVKSGKAAAASVALMYRTVEEPTGLAVRRVQSWPQRSGVIFEHGPRERGFLDEAVARLRALGADQAALLARPVFTLLPTTCNIVRAADGTNLRKFSPPIEPAATSADGTLLVTGRGIWSWGEVAVWPTSPPKSRWAWGAAAFLAIAWAPRGVRRALRRSRASFAIFRTWRRASPPTV